MGDPTLRLAVRRAVAIAAEDLPAADIAADPRAAAIVAATPEVGRAVVRPAEVLRLQAVIPLQDTMAVDSSRAGARPASTHRSPSGGSERSLLLFLRVQMERRELVC